MSQGESVKRSLEVGFSEASPLPERFCRYRGVRDARAIALMKEFPYEDGQFEVVLMAPSAVNRDTVREAHRVLRPAGRLLFSVPEKTNAQDGFSLPDVYSIIRYGFDIIGLSRPHWWLFGLGKRVFTIEARKKNWRELDNTYRPLV